MSIYTAINGLPKHEAAERLYPGIACDTALPQGWVNSCRDAEGFDVRPCVVWAYPAGSVLGIPYPLTAAAADFLASRGYQGWKDIAS